MNLNLRQVSAFVHTYHLGSLTKASQRLCITQGAVSVLLRQLETELGVQLFDRSTRSVKPTAAAHDAIVVAEELLGCVDRLRNNAQGLVNRDRGRVVFSAGPAVAAALMPPVLRAFSHRFPRVQAVMRDISPEDLVESVLSGEVEFSVGMPERRSPDISLQLLAADRLSVICRKDSELASRQEIDWQELRDWTTISSRRGSSIRHLIDDALAEQGQSFEPDHEAQHLTTAMAMTEQGLGVSVLPSYLVPGLGHQTLMAIPLVRPSIPRDIYIITRRDSGLSHAAQSFIDILCEQAGDAGANGS